MQIRIVLITLLCNVLALQAQSTHFTVKESQKFKDQHKVTKVLAVHTTNEEETIIARSLKTKLMFEGFDAEAKSTFNKFVPLEKKEVFTGELFYGDELKVFTVYSPSKTERIIYCHILNTLTKNYKKETLFTTVVEKKQRLFSGQNKRQTHLAISPDEKFLAIATDNIKKTSNSYIIHVFDAVTLQLNYQKTYYENKERFFRSSDLAVDNQGNVYTLGKEYISGRAEKKGEQANYAFVLSKINETNTVVKKIAVKENRHIQSLKIESEEESLKLLGFFSETFSGRIKGIVQFRVALETMDIEALDNKNLPQAVFEDLYGYRKAEKKSKKELKNFYLDHILKDDLGNTYLLAEEFYVTQQYISNGTNGGYWVTVFHYDDILILKLNENGDLEWGRSIFKRAGEPSYNAFLKENQLHVILNSGKNLKEKKDGRVKASKSFWESSSLYDFTYTESGEITREKIQDNNGNTTYIPYLGNYKKGKFIMFNHSKNNRRLMILDGK